MTARVYPLTRKKRQPLVQRTCQACGKVFMEKPSNIAAGKGKACSKACSYKVRKTRSDKKPRKQNVCQWCGKVFIDHTHTGTERERQYCSNKCSGLSKRKDRTKHPRRTQTAECQEWARKVILRDKVCLRCGAVDKLQAHHIQSYAEHPELRFDVDNGASLCPVCHHAQHPEYKLEWFLNRGGQKVQRCVVCEAPFVPRRPTQRSCSVSCGAKVRQRGINQRLLSIREKDSWQR